jgi:GPH family glycoside/pentoside/hexuronide:cation symporter
MENTNSKRKSLFESPFLKSKVTSANVKIFPEGLLGYFLGPFLAIISNAIFTGYLNRYYTDVLQLTKWASTFISLMPIISVILVVAGNLLVGRLMDKTRTKAGKARPLLLLSAPLLVIAICLLFLTPMSLDPNDPNTVQSSIVSLVWIAVSYNIYYSLAYPFYYTSHSALLNLSTRNSKHRGLLATLSNAAAIAAVGFGCNIVFPLFQGLLFKTNASKSVDAASSYGAWRIFMIGLVIITFLGILVEYFFTRERISEETMKLDVQEEKIPLKRQISACVKDKYWWFILLFFFLFQFGGLLKNSSMVYYCRWMFLDNDIFTKIQNPETAAGSLQSILAIVGGIPTGLGIILAWPLANKFGKGKTMCVGCFLSVLGGLVSIIAPHDFYLVTTGVVLKGIGSIPAMFVSLALLSDVLDHLEAKNGFRSDGFTMAVYGAIMVGLNGLANGIINGLLGATGYDATKAAQGEATDNALVWCYLGGELVCYLIIAVMFIFMNVEKFTDLDHKAIKEDQKQNVLSHGGTWVEPEVRLANEQKEADDEAEKARIEELKAYCLKKKLDFEQEEQKYEADQDAKQKKAEAKKAAAEKKKEDKAQQKAVKLKAADDKRRALLQAKCLKESKDYETEEKAYEAKEAEEEKKRELKKAEKEKKTLEEFNQMRRKEHKTELAA